MLDLEELVSAANDPRVPACSASAASRASVSNAEPTAAARALDELPALSI